jgi:hypothetical protein
MNIFKQTMCIIAGLFALAANLTEFINNYLTLIAFRLHLKKDLAYKTRDGYITRVDIGQDPF